MDFVAWAVAIYPALAVENETEVCFHKLQAKQLLLNIKVYPDTDTGGKG